LDVADEKAVQKMVSSVTKAVGCIDGLINNAGIAAMNHSFLTPLSVMEKIFATNVYGTFLFCREVGKVMAKYKKGRIINFATVATPIKLEGESAYAASKAAVENMTQIIAKEFAPFGVTVNAVAPTPVLTDLIRYVPKDKMEALLNRQAIKRFGEMDDISNVIDFYLNEKSCFITGQVLYLGGVS
jgi:3-oxoacyl-[acyl-carrier protein] reductase